MGPPMYRVWSREDPLIIHSTFMESALYYTLGSVLGTDLAMNKMPSRSPQFDWEDRKLTTVALVGGTGG